MSKFNLTHSLTRAEAISLRNKLNRFLKPKPKPTPKPNTFGSGFKVAASYFDALRARHLVKDLNYFKRKGVGIVRVYLNFSYPPNKPWRFLFRPDGTLDKGKLGQLHKLLKLSNKRKMIVDISSSRRKDPDGWQMTPQAYGTCWRTLAKQLKFWGYTNYIIDLENEHNCGWAGSRHTMSQERALSIRNSIRLILPDAHITASVACHISPEAAAAMAKVEGMNVLAYHDPRGENCIKDSEPLARRCKKAFSKGLVYFQEPCQIGWQDYVKNADDLTAMLNGAKKAKIASWCFHSDASFNLSGGTFESRLLPEERKFMEMIKK